MPIRRDSAVCVRPARETCRLDCVGHARKPPAALTPDRVRDLSRLASLVEHGQRVGDVLEVLSLLAGEPVLVQIEAVLLPLTLHLGSLLGSQILEPARSLETAIDAFHGLIATDALQFVLRLQPAVETIHRRLVSRVLHPLLALDPAIGPLHGLIATGELQVRPMLPVLLPVVLVQEGLVLKLLSPGVAIGLPQRSILLGGEHVVVNAVSDPGVGPVIVQVLRTRAEVVVAQGVLGLLLQRRLSQSQLCLFAS
jgi:hypothetical protein